MTQATSISTFTRFLAVVFLTSACYLWVVFSSEQKDNVLNDHMASRPAVGISLTANHGTLAIKNSDGSFTDIGRVIGSEEYLITMKKFSSPLEKHLSSPYSSLEEMWQDAPRVAKRALRKRLGLPATTDVGILAQMIQSLLKLNDDKGAMQPLVISYPPTIALYEEDIIDAAAYLNLQLQYGVHIHQPREIIAAYAGHGKGLCTHPQDKATCLDELYKLPVVQVLHVELTKSAMLLHTQSLQGAQDMADSDVRANAAWSLGLERVIDKEYLSQTQEFVTKFLIHSYAGKDKEMTIIMTGDEDGASHENVKEAIANGVKVNGFTLVGILDAMQEYGAARGAAELCSRGRELSSPEL